MNMEQGQPTRASPGEDVVFVYLERALEAELVAERPYSAAFKSLSCTAISTHPKRAKWQLVKYLEQGRQAAAATAAAKTLLRATSTDVTAAEMYLRNGADPAALTEFLDALDRTNDVDSRRRLSECSAAMAATMQARTLGRPLADDHVDVAVSLLERGAAPASFAHLLSRLVDNGDAEAVQRLGEAMRRLGGAGAALDIGYYYDAPRELMAAEDEECYLLLRRAFLQDDYDMMEVLLSLGVEPADLILYVTDGFGPYDDSREVVALKWMVEAGYLDVGSAKAINMLVYATCRRLYQCAECLAEKGVQVPRGFLDDSDMEDFVKSAIRKGAPVHVLHRMFADGEPPFYPGLLHYAAQQDAWSYLQWMADTGRDVNGIDDKYDGTPLHAAVLRESAMSVETLLAAGADETIANAAGKLPVDLAREQYNMKVERSWEHREAACILAMLDTSFSLPPV